MRMVFKIGLIVVFLAFSGIGQARAQSNYNDLNRVYAKSKYYYPSRKYKNACSTLAKKNTAPRKFSVIKKKRPRKRAEQP